MQLTDYAENKLIDAFRQAGLTLPASWYFALATAGDDTGITEVTGSGYARTAVARDPANFTNTQVDGTTADSSGTSHATGNTAAISWGDPAGPWGTASVVGIMDALTGGNCWFWVAITPVTITTGNPNPVQVAAGALQLVFGATSGVSDFLANALVDLFFRAVAYTFPASPVLALYTTLPTKADTGGVEVSGGGYARQTLALDTTGFSATNAAGSTGASGGTSGRSSNNSAVVFPAPSANWGAVAGAAIRDTTGNLLFLHAVTTPTTVNSGGPAPTFDVNTIGIAVS